MRTIKKETTLGLFFFIKEMFLTYRVLRGNCLLGVCGE